MRSLIMTTSATSIVAMVMRWLAMIHKRFHVFFSFIFLIFFFNKYYNTKRTKIKDRVKRQKVKRQTKQKRLMIKSHSKQKTETLFNSTLDTTWIIKNCRITIERGGGVRAEGVFIVVIRRLFSFISKILSFRFSVFIFVFTRNQFVYYPKSQ